MPVFETNAPSDPLGLWDTTPQTVSFGIEEETASAPEPAVPVYKVNLPASGTTSSQIFAQREAYAAKINTLLNDIPAKLENIAQKVQPQPPAAPGVSFSVSDLAPEPDPETALLNLLSETDSAAHSRISAGQVSFGLGDEISAAYGQAKASFDAFLEQINHEVLHFAWVETSIDGHLMARSVVDWSGDTKTFWDDNISGEQQALHQRVLNSTAQTRRLKLRLFVTVASGAAKISALMVTGSPVLALPAVYQYVISLISQAKNLQSIQSS